MVRKKNESNAWRLSRTFSASAVSTFAQCPRKYWYAYERRLVPDVKARALTFGTAWHKLMEIASKTFEMGDNYNPLEELQKTQEVEALTDTEAAIVAGMGAAFLELYCVPAMETEKRFDFKVPGSTWWMKGFVDGITVDGAVVEYKTTSAAIDEESDYWTRLKFNLQVLMYAYANGAKQNATYFVMRKPMLKISKVPVLDKDGMKVVIDLETGERALNKNGTPRQSAGAGFELCTRDETQEEYAARLYQDAMARPEYYFARREVPVRTTAILEALTVLRVTGREILLLRKLESDAKRTGNRPQEVWRRNCTEINCKGCAYASICIFNNLDLTNKNAIPEGFTRKA